MASEGGETAANRRTDGSRSSSNRRVCSGSNPNPNPDPPNPDPDPNPNLEPNLKQAHEVVESRDSDRLPPELSAQGSEVILTLTLTLTLSLFLTLTLIQNQPLTLTLTRRRGCSPRI